MSQISDDSELWLGCGSPTNPMPFPVPALTPIVACRELCSGQEVAGIQLGEMCTCASLDSLLALNHDVSLCDNSTDWHFYSVSGLAEQDSGYEITVDVHVLGEHDYVKPFEAVEIEITTNFVQDTFTVDFGDGTTVDIVGHSVSYYWTVEGKFDITVSTAIGIAQISGAIDFLVQDVDEGYAGDFVMLNAFHGDKSRQVDVDFVNIDRETGLCDIWFGESDGIDQKRVNLAGYVENSDLFHEYTNVGRYKMSVECHNPYGLLPNETFFTAKKLETTYHYLHKDLHFTIPVSGDTFFFDNTAVVHNDPSYTISPRHESMDSFVLDPAQLRIQENYIEYVFNNEVIDSRIINVQEVIGKPRITSDRVDGAWNLSTSITVTLPPGNNMFVNVSFGLGIGEMFYVHHQANFTAIEFMVNYTELGYYPVQANISNDVSFNTSDLLVSVEVPITMMELSISDIVDKDNPVVLKIDINDGMQGPMKINFEIDHGNGYVDTYHHYSDKFFFETYTHKYIYPDWGDYVVCVRAYNNIGSVFDCINVQVGQRITYVDIITNTNGRFSPGDFVKSLIRCPKGSDKVFSIDFGDGETFVVTDRYLKETENFIDTTTTAVQTTTSTPSAVTPAAETNSSSTNVTGSTGDVNATTNGSSLTTESQASSGGTTSSYAGTFPPERRRREVVGATSESFDGSANTYAGHNSTNESTSPTTSMYLNPNGTTSDYSYVSGNNNLTGTSGQNKTNPTTERATTSTAAPTTTTTAFVTSTIAPIPDDAIYPHMTNDSTARIRSDGTIVITHKYKLPGTYRIKVSVSNTFNWAYDELCPPLIIANKTANNTCQPPVLTITSKLVSSKQSPLQFFRSEQINLTAVATFSGCGTAAATYSWRTQRLVEEDGMFLRRPYHDSHICVLETQDKIFRYPRASLPFGDYVATLVVSPEGYPLQAVEQEFYFTVKPSAPHAIIEGNKEHLWFLVYGTTMIKFPRSIDPDFDSADGVTYDLVIASEKKKNELKTLPLKDVKAGATLVIEGITHKYTSKNPVSLYQIDKCFKEVSGNLTKDIRFPSGQFYVPSEYFEATVNSFVIFLYASKNNLTSSALATFEIRLSNASNLLDQLDDLLASKDTTGVMRAVSALSALITEPVGTTR